MAAIVHCSVRVGIDNGFLMREMPDAIPPGLQVDEPQASALADKQFDGSAMQTSRSFVRAGHFRHEGCLGTIFDNYQCMTKIPAAVGHGRHGVQRLIQHDIAGNVEEVTTGKDRRMQGGEPVSVGLARPSTDTFRSAAACCSSA